MLVRSIILKTSALKPVERMVRQWRMFRPLVKRFIAGDTLPEALAASKVLLDKGFYVTLDLLGENTKTEAEAMAAKSSYIEMLEAIAQAVPSPIPTAPVAAGVPEPAVVIHGQPSNLGSRISNRGSSDHSSF